MKHSKVTFKKPKVTTCISIHRVLAGIGDNLFKLFYPVLIYNATGSLMLAALFMIIRYTATAISCFLFKKMFYKNALIFLTVNVISTIIVQLIFTINIAFTTELIIVIALTTGIFHGFYWTPINTLFASTSGKNANKSLRVFESTFVLGKMVAPAIGGVLLNSGNAIASLVLCTVVYMGSLIALYIHYKSIAQTFRKIEIEQPETMYSIVKKQNAMYDGYWFLWGVVDFATSCMWPLLLAVKDVSIAQIGIVSSIALATELVSQFLASYLGSKNKWYTLGSICMFLRAAFLIVMPFILTSTTMIVYSVVIGLLLPVYNNPFMAEYIKFSSGNNMLLNNMCDREISIHLGKSLGSLFLILGAPLITTLIITASPYLFQWGSFYLIKYQKANNIDVTPHPPGNYTSGTV